MNFPEEQIEELRKIAPNLSIAQEGGYTYILIEKLSLPDNCQPSIVDALLCPTHHPTGYNSRLFFSEKIEGCPDGRNWNGSIRILERNWLAISWNIPPDQRLSETLIGHLKSLRK